MKNWPLLVVPLFFAVRAPAHPLTPDDLHSLLSGHGRTLIWGESRGIIDKCDQQATPAGDGHPLSDDKLRFNDFRDTGTFLDELSGYLYSFDSQYIAEVAKLVEKSDDVDVASIFAINALSPYLGGLGYPELKKRYVGPAMANLKCLDERFGITGLANFANIHVFQEMAIKMLAQSLQSARPLVSDAQKARASAFVVLLGDVVAHSLADEWMAKLKTAIPDMRKLVLDLSANPFLRSRSATDTALLGYLAS